MKDKQPVEGFYPLAAIYWPESRIPLNSWRAAFSTTNGNEQAHRNINRDGTMLTLLAGIMRGLQFDSRALGNLKFLINDSIQPRDRSSTHFQRLLRGIRVKCNILFVTLFFYILKMFSFVPAEDCTRKGRRNFETAGEDQTGSGLHRLSGEFSQTL